MKTRRIAFAVAMAVGGAAVAALSMGGTAAAYGFITGDDIQDGSITGRDIRNHSITERDLSDGAQQWLFTHGGGGGGGGHDGHDGHQGSPGHQGPPGAPGAPGHDATYVGEHWGMIERNTVFPGHTAADPDFAGGYAALRSGPYETIFGSNLKPPSGIGSLHIQTPSGNDGVDFGNGVDFLGNKVSLLTDVAFDVYTSQENQDAGGVGNVPGVKIEIDPDGPGPLLYTTMVFVPTGAASQVGRFTHFTAADGTWFFTGSFGTSVGCSQTGPACDFTTAKSKVPLGTIWTVGVGKGRDGAFSGAVDDLRINSTVYDFEPFGVYARPAV